MTVKKCFLMILMVIERIIDDWTGPDRMESVLQLLDVLVSLFTCFARTHETMANVILDLLDDLPPNYTNDLPPNYTNDDEPESEDG